jgi:hypothetical protein
MTRIQSIQAGLVPAALLTIPLLASPAAATLRIPDCDGLAAWAKAYERGAQWKPNDLGTRHWFPPPFAAQETEALFGKPVLAWSVDEANELARVLRACERPLRAANRLAERNDVNAMGTYAGTNVARYLTVLAEARQAVPESLAALESAPPSQQMLQFWSALSRATTRQGFNAANQATGQLQGDAQAQARTLMAALRDLPEGEIGPAVVQVASARAGAMRASVREQTTAEIVAEIAAMPASAQSLQALAAAPQAYRQRHAALLGPEEFRAIDEAIAARRAAIGDEAEKQVVSRIAAIAPGAPAFLAIDREAPEALLRILPPANAGRVRAAADAQRQKTAEALVPAFQQELAALPETQEGIDMIDGTIKPSLAAWPQSAAGFKPRFAEAAEARRAAILAVVNRAERGSLRGRVYESRGGFSLEFVDRTRVFFKQGQQTAAGTYTEEADGRVVVTVNNQSMVLAREGRKLTGGPTDFTRTK